MSTSEMPVTSAEPDVEERVSAPKETGETVQSVEKSEPVSEPVAAATPQAEPTSNPVESAAEATLAKPEQPLSTAEAQLKLNPGATEFISRSSSTGPGAEGETNTLTGSRHAAGAGRGGARRGRQSGPGRAVVQQPQQGGEGVGNPVVLAPVAGEGDVVGMVGFKGKGVREARPPRGYVPPAPERKARLTAEELEEKMAKMRLLNERTQAEQEARNADAQAYETQVSAERERAIKERERRKAEAEAKSKRTLAVQASIDQQREQYRLRKLKLLESQGGLGGGEQEESFGPREPRPQGEGYGGYGYRGGRMGGRGGYAGQGYENGEARQQEQYTGSGRGDYRGRGRGGGGNRGRPASGVTPRPVAKAQQAATVPDAKDAGAFPSLGDAKTTTDVGKDAAVTEGKEGAEPVVPREQAAFKGVVDIE